MRRCFAHFAVALLIGVFANWHTQVGAIISYDAALFVQRGVATAAAAALGMSLGMVAFAAFQWYGVCLGVLTFEPHAQAWRAATHERLTANWTRRARRVWRKVFGGRARGRTPGGLSWVPFGLVWRARFVVRLALRYLVLRIVRWTERRHWTIQLAVLFLAAVAPNGIWICITIMNGWRSERMRWQYKAVMLGVTNTAACLVWQLVLGTKISSASGYQRVAIDTLQTGMYVALASVVSIWAWHVLRPIVTMARQPTFGWRPMWYRARA